MAEANGNIYIKIFKAQDDLTFNLPGAFREQDGVRVYQAGILQTMLKIISPKEAEECNSEDLYRKAMPRVFWKLELIEGIYRSY